MGIGLAGKAHTLNFLSVHTPFYIQRPKLSEGGGNIQQGALGTPLGPADASRAAEVKEFFLTDDACYPKDLN